MGFGESIFPQVIGCGWRVIDEEDGANVLLDLQRAEGLLPESEGVVELADNEVPAPVDLRLERDERPFPFEARIDLDLHTLHMEDGGPVDPKVKCGGEFATPDIEKQAVAG